jgi:hypothetical protein
MLRLIFKFVGGPLDGKTVTGTPQEEGEAREYYTLTYHGRVGQRFKVASDYAVDMLASEQLRNEGPHHFQQHVYEVVERIRNRQVLLVRAEYVERPAEEGEKV